LYIKNLKKNGKVIKIIENFDNDYWVIDNDGDKLLVLTNYNAPKYKVIAIDINDYSQDKWSDFIPEKEGVLQSVSIVGDKIIAKYLKDAHSHVEIYDLSGKYLYDLELPVLGTVSGFGGKKTDSITFYTITSFTTPATVYKYNVYTNKSEKYQETKVDFNADDYVTKQVFYTSKDGTKVPMFIVHKKGIKMDGNNPVLLYGYGGFNISLTPSFSVVRLVLLEQGVIYAQMNLRGGGEYGQEWHKAGTKMHKQNVFDDCIAAAEYLISEKYTSKGKIALQGGSNGGLLVGAVVNQRPDLFDVAFPAVGVMDMLRYHKFTIGRYWATDYGTSEDSEEMFNYLISYSPVHTVKDNVEYPAILVTTADHDDRVVPAHSFKYIATLQEKYKGNNPVLIRIETKAGHGAGKPTAKIIDEYTDIYSFMFYNLGITPKY
jgi:prolyl oligopeptidase